LAIPNCTVGEEELYLIDDGLVHALDGNCHGTENNEGVEAERLSPSVGVATGSVGSM